MKTFVAVLLALLVLPGHDQFVKVPLNDPLKSFAGAPIEETVISGKTLATITNGDFVHPTFSPDANTLAYARVLTSRDTENTEVLLRRVSNRQTSVLLSAAKAWRYATYKASAQDMSWQSPTRLEVEIHDGDVDATRLIFNPRSRRLIREEQLPSVDEEPLPPPIPVAFHAARKQALTFFPQLPAVVLDNALRSSPILVADRGIVLQQNYHGADSNIWLLDFQNRSMESLIKLSDQNFADLGGGIILGSSIVMLLSDRSHAYLFQYREGMIRPLVKIEHSGHAIIEVKYSSSERVVFLVRPHPSYERGDNPLFVFDGTLRRVKEYQDLNDVDIDPHGKRIAFCYWDKDKRNIVIKELK
jgi:hypothetical protein